MESQIGVVNVVAQASTEAQATEEITATEAQQHVDVSIT